MPRIVSLIASATEIVCALGFEENLVGRSHECDYPPGVQDYPVCTEPKLNVDAASGEIDRQVKSILADAASVYRVHADTLKELQPDIIITQTQCEVCAVSQKDVELALCDWLESKPRIVSLEPNELADVWRDIRAVAAALDAVERGEELIGRLRRRIRDIAEKTSALNHRPTVACLEWLEPLMAARNWMPELVSLAGAKNLFGIAGRHSPKMTWEDLVESNPDIIVALPCGFDLARTKQEMIHLSRKSEWPSLRAMQAGRVFVTDGNQYFNRPGPRLVESLEILAEMFHPESFEFGHEGTGWQRL